ncbi:protein nervous wreck isoform X1 [Cloeon dipterum]|uniref:protein nervous wreck isoform X1 n=1 Tax=Cloeon dipterum TaxID=197152 RepID=UPI0032209A7A
MQPPPRKQGYAKFLKSLHTEQLNKLQVKNQYECELLDDIRNFTKQRSAIEKSYSEALLKLATVYLNKKIPDIPDIKLEGGEERWNMWNVWRTVLEENEKLAKARLAAVEVFQQVISDDAKVLRAHKVGNAKKCMEQLGTIQKEVQTTVQDVDRHKKLYFDEEYSAHDVRDKAKDIEEKLKKKKGSFFTSITSLQKNSAKLTSKREIMDSRSTGARNDYLLSLAAANAHQTRYFVVDLQNTMLTMESGVFERVQEYLTLIGRMELLTCSATQTSFTRIRDQANKLTRDYNMQCCYLFFPVLKQHIQYEYEKCCNDPIEKITVPDPSSVTAAAVTKEAKRLANKIGRESINIRENTKKLSQLQALRESGQKTDPNDPNGPDLETKIEELKQSIRRSETSKIKAEARITCLKDGGVNVDEFLQDVESLSTLELPRSASALSVHTDASGEAQGASSDSFYDDSDYGEADTAPIAERPSTADIDEKEAQEAAEVEAMMEAERAKIEQMTAAWDDPTAIDWGHEDLQASQPPPADAEEVAYRCLALYNYTAQNPDELSIVENETLEVLAGADYDAGEGWLRARNSRGEQGFVPQNYLDYPQDQQQSDPMVEQSPQEAPGISFSSVDYTVESEELEIQQHAQYQEPPQMEAPPAPPPQQQPPQTQSRADIPAPLNLQNGDQYEYCVAMYDYEATAEEELTFEEGTVLRVLRKNVHSIDDGWWEGEMLTEEGNSVIGLFPSLVVQECGPDGEPLSTEEGDSPPMSAPPVFTPPDVPPFLLPPEDVIVTQPTPEIEHHKVVPELCNETIEEEQEEEEFSMKMSKGQKIHYKTQFSEDSTVTEVENKVGIPDICIELHGEDEVMEDEDEAEKENAALSAQIVITAATPMTEEPEQPFPPPPDEDDTPAEEVSTSEPVTTEIEVTLKETEDEEASSSATNTPPQQHVIPDELELQQLAKLSSLKESDA